MTEVSFHRRDGQIIGFRLKGHAGYSVKGKDIVCAALSTLSQATVLGLKTIVGVKVDLIMGDADLQCYLRLQSVEGRYEGVRVLMETLYQSIVIMAEEYPEYINLSVKEVI